VTRQGVLTVDLSRNSRLGDAGEQLLLYKRYSTVTAMCSVFTKWCCVAMSIKNQSVLCSVVMLLLCVCVYVVLRCTVNKLLRSTVWSSNRALWLWAKHLIAQHVTSLCIHLYSTAFKAVCTHSVSYSIETPNNTCLIHFVCCVFFVTGVLEIAKALQRDSWLIGINFSGCSLTDLSTEYLRICLEHNKVRATALFSSYDGNTSSTSNCSTTIYVVFQLTGRCDFMVASTLPL
jgi:hypothetical protein